MELEIKNGLKGAKKVKHFDFNNKQYITWEKIVTKEEAKKHLYAAENNLGPNVFYFKQSGKLICYEDNMDMGTYIKKFDPSLMARKKINLQIILLQKKMSNLKVAHCDIKPANCVINTTTLQVKLIDWDNMKKFGEDRSVATPILNKLDNKLEICSSKTDNLGFYNLCFYILNE